MTPLGGLMKVLLGGLLAWGFVSGALQRFIDKASAAVSAQGQPAAAAAPAVAARSQADALLSGGTTA